MIASRMARRGSIARPGVVGGGGSTVTTLRPNGSTGNWSSVGGGEPVHGAVSDDLSTTRAEGSSGDSYYGTPADGDMVLALGTADLTGRIINSVTVRARAFSSPGGGVLPVRQRLSGTDSAADSHTLSGSAANFTGAARTTKPGGGAWDQAAVDALEVKITVDGVDLPTLNVVEVWVDVDHSPA